MSLLAAAIVTESSITIKRVPIEFLEIELALLEEMGFKYDRSEEYVAAQRAHPAGRHHHPPLAPDAPLDKIHPMPFPGLNIDNLPFFAVIAAVADGQTLIHDWVYENRAIYLTELNKLGAPGQAARPAPGDGRGADPLVRRRDRLPAGAAPGSGDPAGDAGRRRAPRCCARPTSSTAATRTSPSGSTLLGAQIETFRDL